MQTLMPYSAHSLAIVCDMVVMAALADCMCETHQFWPRRKLPNGTVTLQVSKTDSLFKKHHHLTEGARWY